MKDPSQDEAGEDHSPIAIMGKPDSAWRNDFSNKINLSTGSSMGSCVHGTTGSARSLFKHRFTMESLPPLGRADESCSGLDS